MAQKDDLDSDDEGSSKRSGGGAWKKILLFSLMALLLVGLSITTTLLLLRDNNAADSAVSKGATGQQKKSTAGGKNGKSEEQTFQVGKTPHYLNLDPPFVVNLDDNSGMRFLQVAVSVMAYDPEKLEKVKENMPMIRHYLMLLFSSQKFEDIKTSAGKEKLQAEALAVVRKSLKEATGAPLVDALYLPSIVGQ